MSSPDPLVGAAAPAGPEGRRGAAPFDPLAAPGGPLEPAALLDAWEVGRGRAATERALTLLARWLPSADAASLADLPLGCRDFLLLRLRERTFGPHAECLAQCPDCGGTAEFTIDLSALDVAPPASGATSEIEVDGLRLRVRPATSSDILALADHRDPEALAAGLVRRCTSGVGEATAPQPDPQDRTGVQGASASLPPAASALVGAEMARLDPGADLRFALACPSCGTAWTSLFDVAAFLWAEIDAAATRLLGEVHVLATAYGWSESDILRLPAARRRRYLELVGSR